MLTSTPEFNGSSKGGTTGTPELPYSVQGVRRAVERTLQIESTFPLSWNHALVIRFDYAHQIYYPYNDQQPSLVQRTSNSTEMSAI